MHIDTVRYVRDRDMLRALAIGRIAIGAGLLAAPAVAGRVWIGRDAHHGGTRVFARGFGARDIALGAGTLAALRAGHSVRPWLAGALLADVADAAATWLAREHIPAAGARIAVAVASTAAAQDVWLATRLD
jgi:hypothetical protein